MEVPSETGELSPLTFVENNVAYMKIYGSLGGHDAIAIWNDLCLLGLRDVKHVELYINSGGGSAFAGLSIADQIERFVKNDSVVNAHASGIIASATVPILAVCTHRAAAGGTIFMVHEATLFKYVVSETKSDLESQSEMMKLLANNYLSKLAKYTNLTAEEWGKHEKLTTWFSVEQAIEWGLVDEVE